MEPLYITKAKAMLGEQEIPGVKDNAKILELYALSGHPEVKHDEVPWCAAFVGGSLAKGNKPNTGTLLARDYEKYGVKLDEPEEHCIGVMQRGASGWTGHVGFVTEWNDQYVWMLGGNQKDGVNVSKFPRSKFTAFVKPADKNMDVPVQELVSDSRRMSLQAWASRIYSIGAAGTAAVWHYSQEVVQLAKDNAGLVLLGVVGVTWVLLKILHVFSVREYADGRYVPAKQKEEMV